MYEFTQDCLTGIDQIDEEHRILFSLINEAVELPKEARTPQTVKNILEHLSDYAVNHYDRTFGHYIKYAMRNAMDIATLGTSVNARLSEDKKTFDRVRIAFGVAGPVPMRAPHAEEFINGKPVTLENIEGFGKAVLEDIHPRDSWRASKAFRSHIAVESAKRCLMESVKLAGGEL